MPDLLGLATDSEPPSAERRDSVVATGADQDRGTICHD
jgi:hypothetical protein